MMNIRGGDSMRFRGVGSKGTCQLVLKTCSGLWALGGCLHGRCLD